MANEDEDEVQNREENESGYDTNTIMSASSFDTIISVPSSSHSIISIPDSANSTQYDAFEVQSRQISCTEDVLLTLLFSFGDVCVHLVNGQECDDTQCESKHTFPSREYILNKLVNHSDEQIDNAYELVMRSKVLKKKYLEVFNDFFMEVISEHHGYYFIHIFHSKNS